MTSNFFRVAVLLVLANVAYAQQEPEGLVVVNQGCIEDQAFATSARCYMSPEPIDFSLETHVLHSPISDVVEANPGLEAYLVAGVLPPHHMIATVPVGTNQQADVEILVVQPGPTPFCELNRNEGCSWWLLREDNFAEDTSVGSSISFASQNMIELTSERVFLLSGEYFIRDEGN